MGDKFSGIFLPIQRPRGTLGTSTPAMSYALHPGKYSYTTLQVCLRFVARCSFPATPSWSRVLQNTMRRVLATVLAHLLLDGASGCGRYKNSV